MRGPASSSSTSSAQSRRYAATTSATALSSPGGLGIAASSVKSSSTSGIAPKSRGCSLEGACCCEDGRAALEGARAGGADELTEERRRPGRARLELGMELRGDEPRMVRELDHLDEPPLL